MMAPLKPGPKPRPWIKEKKLVKEKKKLVKEKKKLVKEKKKLIKEKKQILEKLYDRLFEMGGTWYILSERDIDELYENIMEHLGVYDKKTGSFLDEWSKDAKKVHDIFWPWYIKIIKKKLKISRYYAKFY